MRLSPLVLILGLAAAQEPVDLGKVLRESEEFAKKCAEFKIAFEPGKVRATGVIHYRGGGPCEYLVTVYPAKAHETIVLLDKGPESAGNREYVRHLAEVLNNAFLAAGFRKGRPFDWERELPEGKEGEVPPPPRIYPPEGEVVHIYAEWKDPEGKTRRARMSDWLWNFKTIDVMQPGKFVYTGSQIVDEGPPEHKKWLAAELDGLVVAVLNTSSAIIDNTEDGALENGAYEAIPVRIPESGTRVTVVFSKEELEGTEKYPPLELPPELVAEKKRREAEKKREQGK